MRKARENQRPRGYWKQIENRKRFFEEVAEKMRFDPMIESNWANVTLKKIEQAMVCMNLFNSFLQERRYYYDTN